MRSLPSAREVSRNGCVNDAADGVDAVVVRASLAAPRAVETSHGLAAADVEWLTKDVFAAVFDGFGVGIVEFRPWFDSIKSFTAIGEKGGRL